MAGRKLDAARDVAEGLTRGLWPGDLLSVVTSDHRAAILGRPGHGVGEHEVLDRIAGLEATGSGDLLLAWMQARNLVAADHAPLADHRVVVVTDGRDDLRLHRPGSLDRIAESARAGIVTTTVGLGADADMELLEAVARAGRGRCYHLARPEATGSVLDREVPGLLGRSARDLTVRLDPGDHVARSRVYHDFPFREDGGSLLLDVGDLYAREPRRLLAEFLLLPPGRDGRDGEETRVARFTVTAHVNRDGGGTEWHEVTIPVTHSARRGGRAAPVVRTGPVRAA
jgi:Ca-activated chloride channel family protein